jgi:hypothetical protein|tara:strand:+ start:353 stop:661 length:309 start_codon:yes stop_codon:yes gene_type:complete
MEKKIMKKVNKAKNPGLAKLPTSVRNNMGYMKNGGVVKPKGMKNGGKVKPKGMKNGGKVKPKGMRYGGKVKPKGMKNGGVINSKGTSTGGVQISGKGFKGEF